MYIVEKLIEKQTGTIITTKKTSNNIPTKKTVKN